MKEIRLRKEVHFYSFPLLNLPMSCLWLVCYLAVFIFNKAQLNETGAIILDRNAHCRGLLTKLISTIPPVFGFTILTDSIIAVGQCERYIKFTKKTFGSHVTFLITMCGRQFSVLFVSVAAVEVKT